MASSNNAERSRMIFNTMRLIKGMKASDVQDITRRNGHKGICSATVRKLYKKPEDGGTRWPSSRTIETIVYAMGGKIMIVPRGDE